MSEWQPIETAPKGRRIIIRSIEIGTCVASAGWNHDSPDEITWDVVNDIKVTATHWMPLPAPPDTKKKKIEGLAISDFENLANLLPQDFHWGDSLYPNHLSKIMKAVMLPKELDALSYIGALREEIDMQLKNFGTLQENDIDPHTLELAKLVLESQRNALRQGQS